MASTLRLVMAPLLLLACRVNTCCASCSGNCASRPSTLVVCDETSTITLNDEKIAELGLKEMDEIVVSRQPVNNIDNLDPQCISSIDDKTFTLELTDCDPFINENDESITYTWTVRNQPHIDKSDVIQRFTDTCFNVSCVFNRQQDVDMSGLGSGIDSGLKKVILDSIEASGTFDIELTVYGDENLANELGSEGMIPVPDYIYAKVELVNVDPDSTNLHVQIEECKATPTSFSTDSTFYSIIKNGCAARNLGDPSDAINITRNYEIQYGTFQFRSFVWTSSFDQLIYVHCKVKICNGDADGAVCDSLDCLSRRKRRDAGAQSHLIVYGPVRLSSKYQPSPCAQNNGGCSELCNVIDDDVICSCYKGKALMHDGRTCNNVNQVPFENMSDGSNNLIMILLIVLACMSVIISCSFWMMSRARPREPSKYKELQTRVI